MKKLLGCFLLLAIQVSGQNLAPIVTSVITPAGDLADTVRVPFRVADAENDICTLMVAYSLDNGLTWNSGSLRDLVFASNSPQHDTLRWEYIGDLGYRDIEAVRLRVSARDAQAGNGVVSSAFTVKNFSLHNFDPLQPSTSVESVTFIRDSTSSGNVSGIYRFTSTGSRTCLIALQYTLDNGTNWTAATDNLVSAVEGIGNKSFIWYSRTDLAGYTGSGVRLRVVAANSANGKTGTASPSVRFSIDNQAPDFFWAGGVVDTNVVYLKFTADTDTTRIKQVSRYGLNFGRSVVAVKREGAGGLWSAQTDASLVAGLNYTLTLDTLFDTFGNRSLSPVAAAFSCKADRYWPNILLAQPQSPLKGNSTIGFTLSDGDFDTLGIGTVEYRKPGSAWQPATLVASAAQLAPPLYSGSLQWRTATNLARVLAYDIQFRAWVSDTTLRGPFDMIPRLSVDNNTSPSISASVLSPSHADTVSIGYALSDPDGDTLSLGATFSGDGQNWYPATLGGDFSEISLSGYQGALTWLWREDVGSQMPDVVGIFFVRITPMDRERGVATQLSVPVNTTGSALVSAGTLSFHGDTVHIPFTVDDRDSSTVDLACQYSVGGNSWSSATLVGAFTGLVPFQYSGIVKWLSGIDMAGIESDSVYFRIIPYDPLSGVSGIAGPFTIDNNELPSGRLYNPGGSQAASVLLRVSVSDQESDSLNLLFQYRTRTGNFTPCTMTGSLRIGAGIYAADTLSYWWQSATDLPLFSDSVSIRFAAVDRDTGVWDTAKVFIGQRAPVLKVLPVGPTAGGDIPIGFTLVANSADSVTIGAWYSVNGGTSWKVATLGGPMRFAPGTDTAFVTWRSEQDTAGTDISQARLRIRATSHLVGAYAYSELFRLDNNHAPVVSIVPFAGSQGIPVDIRALLYDNEYDPVGTVIQFREADSTAWKPASVVYGNSLPADSVLLVITYSVKIGPEQPDPGENLAIQYYTSQGLWDTLRIVTASSNLTWQTYSDTLRTANAAHSRFRLQFIQTMSSGVSFDNFHIDNIAVNARDNIVFSDSFALSALSQTKWSSWAGTVVNGQVYASPPYCATLDGTGTRQLTTVEFSTAGALLAAQTLLDSADYAGDTLVFRWNAPSDLPENFNDSMYIRMAAFDRDTGAWDTIGLYISEKAPSVSIDTVTSPQSGPVAVSFLMTSYSPDTVRIEAQFSLDGYLWSPMTALSGDTILSGADTVGAVVWQSLSDAARYNAMAQVRLRPHGALEGTWQYSNRFMLDNNVAPSSKLIAFPGANPGGRIALGSLFSDTEFDTLHPVFQYRIGSSGAWSAAHVGTDTGGITGPLVLSYMVKAGPESPDPGENLYVIMVPSAGAPDTLRTITPSTTTAWNAFTDTIPFAQPGSATRLRFIQVYNSGPGYDNYLIDDIALKAGRTVLFSERFDDTTFSQANWPARSSMLINAQYSSSAPYSAIFWGSGARMIESRAISTGFGRVAALDSAAYAGDTVLFYWDTESDVIDTADTVWLRMAAMDYDTGNWDTLSYYLVQIRPVVILEPKPGELSGDIELRFAITASGPDSLTPETEFSTDGITWHVATVGGAAKVAYDADSGMVVWHSGVDLAGKDVPMSRIRMRLVGTVSGLYSEIAVRIDNNEPPTAAIVLPAGTQSHTIRLRAVISDQEKDSLRIMVQFREKNGIGWRAASGSYGTMIYYSYPPGSDTISLEWSSLSDLLVYSDSIWVRLAAMDRDTGEWDTVSFFLNQQAPGISLSPINSEQSDTISAPFGFSYGGTDTTTVAVEYSTNGYDWKSATCAGVVRLTAQEDSGTVRWISTADLGSADLHSVRIRVRAIASLEGAWDIEGPFHLDNNKNPRVAFTDRTRDLAATVLGAGGRFEVAIDDNELDRIRLFCTYRQGDSAAVALLLPDSLTMIESQRYLKGPVEFSFMPQQYGDSIPVTFTVCGADSDTGAIDSLSVYFSKLLGDFNGNGIIDIADLDTFAVAWRQSDFSKNAGPATGVCPYVSVTQDSAFTIEDLSAFIVSWNWSRRSGGMPLLKSAAAGKFTKRWDGVIVPADRAMFDSDTMNGGPLMLKNISSGGRQAYIEITADGPANIGEGILATVYGEGLTIDSISGPGADFVVCGSSVGRSEALRYGASFGHSLNGTGYRVYFGGDMKNAAGTLKVVWRGVGVDTAEYRSGEISVGSLQTSPSNNAQRELRVDVAPNPFTPGVSDIPARIVSVCGIRSGTAICVQGDSATIGRSSASVNIYDAAMNLIVYRMKLLHDGRGALVGVWNGNARSGRKAGPGTYVAHVVVTGPDNQEGTMRAKIGIRKTRPNPQ